MLVIIGLLLGGVLKGTELIESAKVKRAVGELNGVTAAFYAYQDRYRQLPGDDGPLANINARGGVWTGFTSAVIPNGNIAAGPTTTFNPATNSEQELFWRHLKAAGFLNGDSAATGANALPRNAFGGLIGFTVGPVNPPATQISGFITCMNNVPGKSAAAIDTQLDDGNGTTGKMRGVTNGTALNTAGPVVYSEPALYTLCLQM